MSSVLSMRGISSREGGAKKVLSLGLTEGTGKVEGVKIDMDNVHNCSLYELRQVSF
jgi:hypothetical protein